MLFFLIVTVLIGAGLLQLVKRYIFRIKEPSLDEVWEELGVQPWYQVWIKNDQMKAYIIKSKQNGLLADPYYVKRIIRHTGTREGFFEFMEKELGIQK